MSVPGLKQDLGCCSSPVSRSLYFDTQTDSLLLLGVSCLAALAGYPDKPGGNKGSTEKLLEGDPNNPNYSGIVHEKEIQITLTIQV